MLFFGFRVCVSSLRSRNFTTNSLCTVQHAWLCTFLCVSPANLRLAQLQLGARKDQKARDLCYWLYCLFAFCIHMNFICYLSQIQT